MPDRGGDLAREARQRAASRGTKAKARQLAVKRSAQEVDRRNKAASQARADGIARKPHEDVARATEQSVWWTRAAVALSGFAFVASLGAYRLAFEDDAGDRVWRREQRQDAADQLRALEVIRDELRARSAPTLTPTP